MIRRINDGQATDDDEETLAAVQCMLMEVTCGEVTFSARNASTGVVSIPTKAERDELRRLHEAGMRLPFMYKAVPGLLDYIERLEAALMPLAALCELTFSGGHPIEACRTVIVELPAESVRTARKLLTEAGVIEAPEGKR